MTADEQRRLALLSVARYNYTLWRAQHPDLGFSAAQIELMRIDGLSEQQIKHAVEQRATPPNEAETADASKSLSQHLHELDKLIAGDFHLGWTGVLTCGILLAFLLGVLPVERVPTWVVVPLAAGQLVRMHASRRARAAVHVMVMECEAGREVGQGNVAWLMGWRWALVRVV